MCNLFWHYRANQTQLPPVPSQVPIYTPGWREAITVKCLAQGHKYHGRGWDSNPYSNDSAIGTQSNGLHVDRSAMTPQISAEKFLIWFTFNKALILLIWKLKNSTCYVRSTKCTCVYKHCTQIYIFAWWEITSCILSTSHMVYRIGR